jgi:hypothetical protein
MENLGCRQASNNNPVTVIGRVSNPSGQVLDLVFEGKAVLKTTDTFETQSLIQRPSDLAKDFLSRPETPLAFVSIGFGPAPISDFDRLLWKGDFDETKHPRVAGGCPEGGEFCSADEASDTETADNAVDNVNNQNTVLKDLSSRVAKRAARRALRNRLIAGLRIVAAAVADLIPGLGEIFDGYEFGQTIADGIALEKDVVAAKAFVVGGPRSLESLQMGTEYQSFPSFEAFKKDEIGKFFGPADDGYEYHHIVEQGGAGLDDLPAGLMDSTENVVKIPRLLHEEITAEYASRYKDTGKTLRDWLSSQPYEMRRAEGIRVMRDLRIIK